MNRFKVGDNVIDDNQKSWSMPELAKQKNKRQIVEAVTARRVYLDSGVDFDAGSMYGTSLTILPPNVLESYNDFVS